MSEPRWQVTDEHCNVLGAYDHAADALLDAGLHTARCPMDPLAVSALFDAEPLEDPAYD